VAGGAYVLLIFFFGLSAGVVGKIKGSSFLLWFLIGAVLPFFGTIAALLYRFERNEPRRQCPECGYVMPLHNQVCMRCGRDLDWPDPPHPSAQASGPAISGR
jgi:DNA-directed RNA polymerase subunit RPC12/RpoP